MSTTTPNYLRLHVESESALRQPPSLSQGAVEQLTDAFERATGWSLRYHAGSNPAPSGSRIWSAAIGGSTASPAGELAIDAIHNRAALSDPEDASSLAGAVANLLHELSRTQTALWQREAELAAGVPVISRGDESHHMAERLEAILKAGADGLGCQAAAMYLLDAATTSLKLRSSHGLPRARLLEPPRVLAEARADLEALAGHAVTLSTAEQVIGWKAPEVYAAGICVPISSPTVPLGTLWFFGRQPREFSDPECNLAEVIAGRLSVELERQTLLAESRSALRLKRAWRAAQELDQQQAVRVAPCLDGWELAGWAAQGEDLGGAFYDWHMHADGTLMAMQAELSTGGLSGALSSRVLRTAFRAHAETCQQSHVLLERCNRTFWSQSAGDQLASASCLDVDPATGLAGFAYAGLPAALLLSADGHQWLGGPQLTIGLEPDACFARRQLRLDRGDAVVILGERIERAVTESREPLDRTALATMLLDHRHVSAVELTELVRAFLDSHRLDPETEDRSLMAIKRQ